MMSKVTFAFALFAFAAVIQSTSALRCWVCGTMQNPACEYLQNATEHTRSMYLRDCNQGSNSYSLMEKMVCKKQVWNQNGRTIIERSCSTPTPEERDITDGACRPSPSDHQNSYGTLVSCNICSKDECNSATSIVGSRIFQVLSVVLAIAPFVRGFSF